MSKMGFGLGLLVGGIFGISAGVALASNPERREQLRERGIVLKHRADSELARLRSRAEEWREPVQRAVNESVQAARRTSEELGQRLSKPMPGSAAVGPGEPARG